MTMSDTLKMKRMFDWLIAFFLFIALFVPMLIIAFLVKITSEGSVLYWSDRVGINNQTFKMPKFRTMQINTPTVATHLLNDSEQYLTSIGSFLRKSSLDELPQLFNILKGDISFVGPRPALFNQDDLIELRTKNGIHLLMPGLTGWAQVNGPANLPIVTKVRYDEYYLRKRSFLFDLRILLMTFSKILRVVTMKEI